MNTFEKKLPAGAVGTEKKTIRQFLEPEVLNDMRTGFVAQSQSIADLEEEFKKEKAKYKKAIDDKKLEFALNRKILVQGYEDKEMDCALVPDFTAKKMEYVDVDSGEVVYSRKLRPDERQLTLKKAI